MSLILLFVWFFPVWLPLLIACLARQTPASIRVVLALAGIISGFCARSIFTGMSHASGHDRGWGVLLIPFTTAALSFWLAFTGVAAVTAFHFVVAGRAISLPSVLAFGLVFGSIALGIFFVLPFMAAPIQ